ncbi:MAG: CapA family protein [Clostridia bacterium]|nr:CapA family protein [Clostridia bacterium]
MKSRIICLCLCIVALGISMLMTVNLINSEEYTPNVIGGQKDEVNTDIPNDTKPQQEEVALNANAIAYFADKVESFVDTLAYGENKDFGQLDYMISNLDRISSYLSSTEVGDKAGSEYLATLSRSFSTAKNGFASDSDFSSKVSAMLSNIDSAVAKLGDANSDYYPTLNTDAGGAMTLAMLALYEKQTASVDGSTFTVTVGGGALLGDSLGTPEALKFSTQMGKYTKNYPFFAISSVTANDDLTLISLEAPLTTATVSESVNPTKGSPDYAKRMLGIDAVSLASSRVMEYGADGLNETAKALKDNGISYSVQEGSQSIAASFGKVVYITFDLTDTPVTDEQKERNKEVIKNVVLTERENGADIIIVMLHWNTRQRKADSLTSDYLDGTVSEYEAHFDAYNKEIARAAIGNGVSGADLVVGYGSRVAQGIEAYNNKMIVYETGDLTYSGSVDSEMKNTNYAFLFRQTFVKDTTGVKSLSYRIIPIVNTTEDDLYLPQIVFDERADEIVNNLIYQSRYFGNPITSFNYIRINK